MENVVFCPVETVRSPFDVEGDHVGRRNHEGDGLLTVEDAREEQGQAKRQLQLQQGVAQLRMSTRYEYIQRWQLRMRTVSMFLLNRKQTYFFPLHFQVILFLNWKNTRIKSKLTKNHYLYDDIIPSGQRYLLYLTNADTL
jgi:hypothetical protein